MKIHIEKLPWIWLGIGLWTTITAASAADMTKPASKDLPNQEHVKPNIATPANQAPWERTALVATMFVAGAAGVEEQVSPAIVASAVGGALGSVTRLLVSQSVGGWVEQDFPYGTMAVNLIGSFAFGLVSGWVGLRTDTPDTAWFTLVTTGFLGGFTTFSLFAYDAVSLSREEGFGSAATYTAFSVGISIMAILVGESLGHAWAMSTIPIQQ